MTRAFTFPVVLRSEALSQPGARSQPPARMDVGTLADTPMSAASAPEATAPVASGASSSDGREVARKDHARQVLRVDAALAAWTDDLPESLCSRGCDRAVFAEGLCESHFEQRLDDREGER